MDNCMACRFWFRPEGAQIGQPGVCKRYPPTPMLIPQGGAPGRAPQLIPSAMWAPTPANESCGEWKPKVEGRQFDA